MHGATAVAERNLTPRELDVLKGIVGGLKYAEIGARLGIAYDTVKTVTNRIRAKTGAANKAQLAVWAVEHGVKP